jgi:hypothetical protein
VQVDTCWSNTLVLPSVCCALSYLPCEISAQFRRGHSTAEELGQMCNRGNAAVFCSRVCIGRVQRCRAGAGISKPADYLRGVLRGWGHGRRAAARARGNYRKAIGSTVHCRKQAKRNRHSRAGSGRNLSQAGWLPRKCISMSQSGHCSGLVIFLLKVNNTALIPRPSQSYPIRICGSPT